MHTNMSYGLQHAIADHLRRLGYHKPITIETAEELEALPVGSVVLDAEGEGWTSYARSSLRTVSQKRWGMRHMDDEESWVIPLPATLLYRGQS